MLDSSGRSYSTLLLATLNRIDIIVRMIGTSGICQPSSSFAYRSYRFNFKLNSENPCFPDVYLFIFCFTIISFVSSHILCVYDANKITEALYFHEPISVICIVLIFRIVAQFPNLIILNH